MTKKHLFQIRRSEARGTRDKYYSPERDLAYIGPVLIRGAMQVVEPEHWEDWVCEFLHGVDVTYEDILESEAPRMLAEALNDVIHAPDPVAALEASGFTKVNPYIQMFLYARMGQVLLATIWSSVKDVHKPTDEPPASFKEILDDVNAAVHAMLVPNDCTKAVAALHEIMDLDCEQRADPEVARQIAREALRAMGALDDLVDRLKESPPITRCGGWQDEDGTRPAP